MPNNSQESNFSRNYQLFINAPKHSQLRNYKPTHDQQIHVKCIELSDSNAAKPDFECMAESKEMNKLIEQDSHAH